MSSTYAHPVSQLLMYGDCRNLGREPKTWPNYLTLGLSKRHIPDLIKMATREKFNHDSSNQLENWAPVHAWRALGQLRAQAAIKPLMESSYLEEENLDDWASVEFPMVYSLIGPQAIPALAGRLANKSKGFYSRVMAADSLEKIGTLYPKTRTRCLVILTQQIEKFDHREEELNGFLVCNLIGLKAIETLEIIKKAYEKGCVDVTIAGDLDDLEIELALTP